MTFGPTSLLMTLSFKKSNFIRITIVISEKERLRIDATRLFMILGVVLIHCNILICVPRDDSTALATGIVKYFSETWPKFCVPWFFFISAYVSVYLIVVTVSFASYYFTAKIMPNLVNILTGQREFKQIHKN